MNGLINIRCRKAVIKAAWLGLLFTGMISVLQAQTIEERFGMTTYPNELPGTTYGKLWLSSVAYSSHGTYIYIQSEQEVKCFETASGRLLYQSNGGKDIPGFRWNDSYKLIDYHVHDTSLYFSPDEQYLVIRVRMRDEFYNEYYHQFIHLPSGKPVPETPELTRLILPRWTNAVHSYWKADAAKIKVKRDYKEELRIEKVTILKEIPDPADPARTLCFFMQDYVGTKKWRRQYYSDWSDKKFKANEEWLSRKTEQSWPKDYHYVSVGKDPADVVYKGLWRKPNADNYIPNLSAFQAITPDGRYAVLAHGNVDYPNGIIEVVETTTGNTKWLSPKDERWTFASMNDFHNIYLTRTPANSKESFATLVDLMTGKPILSRAIPTRYDRWTLALSPDNGTIAITHYNSEIPRAEARKLALAIHDVATGKLLATLSDDAAYLDYAKRVQSEYAQRAIEQEEANRQYLIRRQKEREEERRLWHEREVREAAEYAQEVARHKDDCPACNGSGRIASRSSYIRKVVVSDGGTYKVVADVKVYQPPNALFDWVPCSRCAGKGKL